MLPTTIIFKWQDRCAHTIEDVVFKVGVDVPMNDSRKAARWRKRRIIFNNDGDDVYEAKTQRDIEWGMLTRKGELIDDYLRARTSPLVGSHVDTVFYSSCVTGLTFSHNTQVGRFLNQGIPKELIDKYGSRQPTDSS